jgi:hypothetical protein
VTRGPDFIIIGAMKCATSTLHEQLALQPGIVMSTPKEPNFFSDDDRWSRGFDWYHSLFASAADDDLCGEASTHYTKLPTYPRAIERMQPGLGDHVRFIYIMRHPVDRFVSHYVHAWSQGRVPPIDRAVNECSEMTDYGRYAMQLEPYVDTFGCDRVLPIFFDRLATYPQAELERVCRFIGYRGQPCWRTDLERQNVSSSRLRQTRALKLLMGFPGSRMLRRRFVPQSVRDTVKRRWSMSRRPDLSASVRWRLESIFDADLARLGEWLGIELNCANFTAVTRGTIPQWADQHREQAA